MTMRASRSAVGIIDPVIDAAAPQRLVQIARPVRGQHHDRPLGGAHRAALGNGNLEVGQEFEQEGLELLVGAIDLVDQQHGRVRRAQRREHRTLDQEALAIDVDAFVARLPDRQHLARIVPLIERGRRVDALVALQADQPAAEHGGDRLGGFGLADAGRAFEQQRLAEREREIGGRREPLIREVIGGAQRLLQRLRAVDADDVAADRHPSLSVAPAAARRPGP